MREDELAVVPFIEIELAMGFRHVSIERTLRVLADSLRRAAATESDAWRSDLMEPLLARGAAAIELAASASSAETVTLDEATNEAVLAIWHALQAQAWTANIIGGFEKAVADAGLLKTFHRPPAICFLDIRPAGTSCPARVVTDTKCLGLGRVKLIRRRCCCGRRRRSAGPRPV